MFAKLLGIMELNFKNSNGEQVQGANIFVSYQDENVIGEKTDKFYVKKEIAIPEQIKIGDVLNISFNCKGKVEAITKK